MNTHVNIPRGYYIGQVRPAGARLWQTVTGKCKSGESAMSRAALKMRDKRRARVLFIDTGGWYEPTLVMECSR